MLSLFEQRKLLRVELQLYRMYDKDHSASRYRADAQLLDHILSCQNYILPHRTTWH